MGRALPISEKKAHLLSNEPFRFLVIAFALFSFAEVHFRRHLLEALGLDAEDDGAKCQE